MKKNLLIIYILFCISNCLQSQTPGFMGKRFAVGYGFYFWPALTNSNGAGKSFLTKGNSESGSFAFNTMHEAFIEYAIKPRFSIGFSAKYYKTTYNNALYLSARQTYIDNSGYSNTISIYGKPNGLYTIRAVNYNIYGKLFYSRYIAPWGRYMMFGLNIKTYTCSYDPKEMYLNIDNNYYTNIPKTFTDFGPEKQKYKKFDFLFGLGRTRIIANKIIIDYGFNTNLFSLLTTLFDAIGEDTFIDRIDNTDYIKRTSSYRVRGANRFNVFLKVGYLF